MRIAVVGAGIVGVTTAYELAAAGHEVHVYERRTSVAAETSFANAGVVAPGYVTPWAAPGMPMKVLLGLMQRDSAVRLDGLSALREWRWIWAWLRACSPRRYAANRTALLELARSSQARMQALTQRLNLSYEQRRGYLVLLRGAQDLQRARPGLEVMAQAGITYTVLDAEAARRVEPQLHTGTALHAAIHLPDDGVGNCRQFAHAMKAQAQRLGAVFHFGAPILRVEAGSPPRLHGAAGAVRAFDRIVLCTGVQANALLARTGMRLPLAPVYGYSISAPLSGAEGEALAGPTSGVMDERFKVAITRLGQRVRVAGSAELGGHLDRISPAAVQTLWRVLEDWYPGAAVASELSTWKGARPMLPDGPPVVGPTPAPGLWINLGHGSSGFALACGCAQLLAQAIAERRDAPDRAMPGPAALSPSRWLRATG